jgi:hypothetical protein
MNTKVIKGAKKPIIIIAAGRSGTKLLRDMLCTHSKLVTWPCDEINPLWRFGSARYPTDELPPERATSKVKHYIRSKFERVLSRYGGERVVEKTCANSLRVDYVYGIFPEAQFIHLIRDGRDVASSARHRWTGAAGIRYTLRKARWVPLQDMPHYAIEFVKKRLYRRFNRERKVKSWGPRFSGIDALVRTMSLIEVCGVQWVKSIEASRGSFENIPSSQVFEIRYEELARRPIEMFKKIFEFCGLEFQKQSQSFIQTAVTDRNIGKWRYDLSEDDLAMVMPHIQPVLKREGYI